jgi:hypothetical protein
MIDRQEQPPADLAGERDDPIVGCDRDRTDGGRDVDATVPCAVGVVGWIEATDDRAGRRPRPRNRGRTGGRPRHGGDHNKERADPSHRGDAIGGAVPDP